MKKITAIILSILLAAITVLPGCSKSGEKTKGSKTTIKFATFYTDEEQGAVYKEIAKEYEKKNSDVKVEVKTNYSDEEKIKESISNTGDIDIVGIKRDQLIEYAKSGYLTGLSEFIETNKLDNKLYKISLAYGRYNGKSYGIGDLPMTFEWFYNIDIFNKYGIKEPETLNDLINISQKLKGSKIKPIELGAMDYWTLSLLFGSITAQTTGSKDITAGYASDAKTMEKTPGIKNAFSIFSKLTSSCITKDCADINYKQSINDFINGKTAIIPSGSWSVKLIEQEKNPNFNYGVFKSPIKYVDNPINMVSASAGEVLVLPAKGKNSKEAQKFLEYLMSDEAQKIYSAKGYTSPLITSNGSATDLQKNILTHIEMADDNSIMLMDNVEPKLSENLGRILQDLFEDRVKASEAWSRVLKITYQK